ncbi:MAG: hypothetical protein ACOCQR_00245 [bacterium]
MTISKIIKKMQEKGYIFILKDEDDIGINYVGKIKKSKKQFQEDIKPYQQAIEKEKEVLIKLLKEKRYNEYISKAREKNKYEPRPDLKEDTLLWQALLKLTQENNRKLYGILHGFRCYGAKLLTNKARDKIKLVPRFEEEGLWKDNDEWKKDAQDWLIPYKKEIEKLLEETIRKTTA